MNPINVHQYTTTDKRKRKRKVTRSKQKITKLNKKCQHILERIGGPSSQLKKKDHCHRPIEKALLPLEPLLSRKQNKRTPSPATNDEPLSLNVLCNLQANANKELQLDGTGRCRKLFRVRIHSW